jgi:hypothetical protein
MKFEDLSPEDQRLLNTDLGAFEKEASARLELANEMYEAGFSKLASETADALDEMFAKTAGEEAADNSIKLDDESEKIAQELGAFIEKGYVDGLKKLGQERHGDESAYFMPFIEEKIAAEGAKALLSRFGGKMKSIGAGAVEKAKKGYGAVSDKAKAGYGATAEAGKKGVKSVKDYHAGAASDLKEGIKGKEYGKAAKGGAKLVGPYAALLGAGGAAAYAAKKKKD